MTFELAVNDAGPMAQPKRRDIVADGIRELAKKASSKKTIVDINEVIREADLLLGSELVAQRVNRRFQLKSMLPPIAGDRVQLRQVIINLFINAIEAMQHLPDGARSLEVCSLNDDVRGIVIYVKDNGSGFTEETGTRLFEPFFSTKPSGLGIGLSICRSIVENHGGQISAANNRSGAGATFEFTLPSLSPVRRQII